MNIETLKNQLPDYAKDTRLNLSTILADTESNLSPAQIAGIALASAYATRNANVIAAMVNHAQNHLDETALTGIKTATSIMAMNNIYYRFTHLVSDKDYAKMPARLRMNAIANHGIGKEDFELYALAVSAINGCGLCMDAHVQTLQKAGLSKEAIQTCVRIAAVISSAAQTLVMEAV